jgi:hypothetical protein
MEARRRTVSLTAHQRVAGGGLYPLTSQMEISGKFKKWPKAQNRATKMTEEKHLALLRTDLLLHAEIEINQAGQGFRIAFRHGVGRVGRP